MQIIGAGLGRTGTASLKLALEMVLGEPCYHMFELMNRPNDAQGWQTAADGGDPDWVSFLSGWGAVVDWPASSYYREMADAFPNAKVLLSERDAEGWWASAERTIFSHRRKNPDHEDTSPLGIAASAAIAYVGVDPLDKDVSIEAFTRHNAQVRKVIPADRLIIWQPGDGWGPICNGLGVAIPDEPYPHSNSSASFLDTVKAAVKGDVERIVDPPPVP